jgi:hypothetical protein
LIVIFSLVLVGKEDREVKAERGAKEAPEAEYKRRVRMR